MHTQINRLAGLAVLCHCFLPATWVPPLNTPNQLPEGGPSIHTTLSSVTVHSIWMLDMMRPTEHQTLLRAPRSDAYAEPEGMTTTASDDSFPSELQGNSSFESELPVVING